jgi:Nucleotidyl transferase AbiEii toxin, Type IV TA system
MTERGFRDPQALRRSVTDRLRAAAMAEPHATLADLLRQFAYDRLLCRIFSGDGADRWVLKGATAMLVRLGSDSRHTRDVDLYSNAGNLDDAEAAFRIAAAQDMRDFFRFEVGPGVPVAGPSRTRRLRVTAYLGATRFASFPVDLVTNLNMTGAPEILGPLIRTRLPGIATTAYRVYPAADHVADKVCALLEVHDRVGGVPQPSTRYRDLVDLTMFARTTPFHAEVLMRAVRSEAARRGLVLPHQLKVPSRSDWPAGYAREARALPALVDRDLQAAADTAKRLMDPVLSGVAAGRWDPHALTWTADVRQ